MTTSAMFWALTAIVVLSCAAYAFISKAVKASNGNKLIIDGDSVKVSDDELQDFMFEVEEKAASEIVNVNFDNTVEDNGHAVA